jgi:hypothetical protein
VKYLPSPAAIQSFLDEVFLEQANIKMNVTVLPSAGVAWDKGLGPLFLPAPGGPLPHMWHNNDRVLQVLNAYGAGHEDWTTLEEETILTAVPPSQDEHTITVYWVRAEGLVSLKWIDEVAETNRVTTHATITRNAIAGFANMSGPLAGGRVAWVLDRQTAWPENWSALHTLAHELGHMLGLDMFSMRRMLTSGFKMARMNSA